MKKQGSSLSRFASGIAVLFLIFSISNSCTKLYDDSGAGATLEEPLGFHVNIAVRSFSQGTQFTPDDINISAGDIVTWVNNTPEIESVTSDNGLFDGILGSNESYSFKFASAGTYTYYSRMNSGLIGKIVVK